MEVTIMPGTYEGKCAECDKHFIRRQIDCFDDGALCTNHYNEWKEKQLQEKREELLNGASK